MKAYFQNKAFYSVHKTTQGLRKNRSPLNVKLICYINKYNYSTTSLLKLMFETVMSAHLVA